MHSVAVKLGFLDQTDGEIRSSQIADSRGPAKEGMNMTTIDVLEDAAPA